MPEPLTDAELADLEQKLRGQRLALNTEQQRMAGSLAAVRSARSDSDAADEHDPEGPTISAEWSRISGFATAHETRSAAIDRALGSIEAGGYGVCIRCGAPIG